LGEHAKAHKHKSGRYQKELPCRFHAMINLLF